MSNCTEPYKDLELMSDGHFKFVNNIVSKFTIDDVIYLNHHTKDGNYSVGNLCKQSGLTYVIVARIINTLKTGGFDEFLVDDEVVESVDELGNTVIHIYDGIHIENHYHYESEVDNKSHQSNAKLSQGKLNQWSKRVRERDNYTCAVCDSYNKRNMEAHHIIPKSIDPSKAYDDLNGVAICQKCHHKYNNRYEIKNQNPVTWTRFLSDERRGY